MSIQPKEIFNSINRARENPNIVLNEIKQQLKRFESNSVFRNKRDIKIRTFSGKAGWQQAVLSIQRQKSKGPLAWNNLLQNAAQQYKQAIAQDQSINPFQVIKSICSYEGNISFNVNQSDVEQDLIQLVAAMIVGDGDQKKGSRTAIFHPLYRQFGCSVRKSGNKYVIYTIFAQSVSQKNSNESPKKQQIKSQSESRSSWQDVSTAKFQSPQQKKIVSSSFAGSKYKNVEQQLNSKQNYIKKGKQLIVQLNKIRKEPKQYVHALKSQISKFKDDKVINADYGIITTKEGQAPYYDLISQLQTQYPLPTIREVTGLSIVGLQQISQGEGLIESKTPIQSLIDKFCASSQGVRSIKLKDIAGMPISAMLMRLLVSDGDRKRTARKKMLSPICKAIGCVISKDVLVVNVAQTAKDNNLAVQQYLKNASDQIQSQSNNNISKKQTNKSFKSSESQSPYFGGGDKISKFSSKNHNEIDRVVVKKISKSHNEQKAGRVYKITQIQTIYNDGQIQKVIQQQLLM